MRVSLVIVSCLIIMAHAKQMNDEERQAIKDKQKQDEADAKKKQEELKKAEQKKAADAKADDKKKLEDDMAKKKAESEKLRKDMEAKLKTMKDKNTKEETAKKGLANGFKACKKTRQQCEADAKAQMKQDTGKSDMSDATFRQYLNNAAERASASELSNNQGKSFKEQSDAFKKKLKESGGKDLTDEFETRELMIKASKDAGALKFKDCINNGKDEKTCRNEALTELKKNHVSGSKTEGMADVFKATRRQADKDVAETLENTSGYTILERIEVAKEAISGAEGKNIKDITRSEALAAIERGRENATLGEFYECMSGTSPNKTQCTALAKKKAQKAGGESSYTDLEVQEFMKKGMRNKVNEAVKASETTDGSVTKEKLDERIKGELKIFLGGADPTDTQIRQFKKEAGKTESTEVMDACMKAENNLANCKKKATSDLNKYVASTQEVGKAFVDGASSAALSSQRNCIKAAAGDKDEKKLCLISFRDELQKRRGKDSLTVYQIEEAKASAAEQDVKEYLEAYSETEQNPTPAEGKKIVKERLELSLGRTATDENAEFYRKQSSLVAAADTLGPCMENAKNKSGTELTNLENTCNTQAKEAVRKARGDKTAPSTVALKKMIQEAVEIETAKVKASCGEDENAKCNGKEARQEFAKQAAKTKGKASMTEKDYLKDKAKGTDRLVSDIISQCQEGNEADGEAVDCTEGLKQHMGNLGDDTTDKMAKQIVQQSAPYCVYEKMKVCESLGKSQCNSKSNIKKHTQICLGKNKDDPALDDDTERMIKEVAAKAMEDTISGFEYESRRRLKKTPSAKRQEKENAFKLSTGKTVGANGENIGSYQSAHDRVLAAEAARDAMARAKLSVEDGGSSESTDKEKEEMALLAENAVGKTNKSDVKKPEDATNMERELLKGAKYIAKGAYYACIKVSPKPDMKDCLSSVEDVASKKLMTNNRKWIPRREAKQSIVKDTFKNCMSRKGAATASSEQRQKDLIFCKAEMETTRGSLKDSKDPEETKTSPKALVYLTWMDELRFAREAYKNLKSDGDLSKTDLETSLKNFMADGKKKAEELGAQTGEFDIMLRNLAKESYIDVSSNCMTSQNKSTKEECFKLGNAEFEEISPGTLTEELEKKLKDLGNAKADGRTISVESPDEIETIISMSTSEDKAKAKVDDIKTKISKAVGGNPADSTCDTVKHSTDTNKSKVICNTILSDKTEYEVDELAIKVIAAIKSRRRNLWTTDRRLTVADVSSCNSSASYKYSADKKILDDTDESKTKYWIIVVVVGAVIVLVAIAAFIFYKKKNKGQKRGKILPHTNVGATNVNNTSSPDTFTAPTTLVKL